MSHIHINFEHVNYSYEKTVPILQDITFTAHENDSIGLIGANGVGKSTLLKLLVGLNPDYEGSIRVEEMPVVKEMLPKVREKIGYVFQDSDSQLFMSTVFEDVAFAPRNYGLPETEVEQRVSHALEQIHIGHLRDKQIYKLSGGEKKMASIATILAMTREGALRLFWRKAGADAAACFEPRLRHCGRRVPDGTAVQCTDVWNVSSHRRGRTD